MATTTSSVSPSSTQVSTAALPAKSPSSEIVTEIIRRSDLSFLYRIVRSIMRPLRPHLVDFGDPYPAGSAQIAKHPHNRYDVEITERQIVVIPSAEFPLPQASAATNTQKLWVYDFAPKQPSTPQPRRYVHTVYYFSGGGFRGPPSSEHWKLCARLAQKLAPHGIRMVLVSYPLSPNSPAKDSLPLLRKWLIDALKEAHSHGTETVSLAGDSSGGNICLTLAFWWADQLQKAQHSHGTGSTENGGVESLSKLSGILVMSPPCDFRNTNPAIAEADKLDPILTRGLTDNVAEMWCKDWPIDPSIVASKQNQEHGPERVKAPGKYDPVLSPNLQTPEAWKALRDSGLVLDGLIGTADCLAPDGEVFMEKCKQERIRGQWLVWEKQLHCFPLTACYGVSEGKEGLEWVKIRMQCLV